MKTIVFYSYKGGTGRTLVLANVARYLQQFNQRVFMVDFDLEAPGLHHKLELTNVDGGVVDYLLDIQSNGRAPAQLAPYVVEVPGTEASQAPALVMPAGRAPSAEYARRLGQLDWHELFYGERPIGVPAFLELKAQIEAQYEPDFLLIDARTGITEIGGVATTILADTVVCLTLNNRENLAGTRMVLRALAAGAPGRAVQLIPALSRVPETLDRSDEALLTSEVLAYLNEPEDPRLSTPTSTTVEVAEVLLLHSEPALQLQERILVGEVAARDSVLLRDYLSLFSRTIPQEVLLPHIENLVAEVQSVMLDDPVGAQRDLEALAGSTGHPIAWRSLIKFYSLRNLYEELLPAAIALWHVKTGEDDVLLWSVVKSGIARRPSYVAASSILATREAIDFHIDVWGNVAPEDREVAKHLIDVLHRSPHERYGEALDIARTHFDAAQDVDAVALLANELVRHKNADEALALSSFWAGQYADEVSLLRVWAQAAIACGQEQAQQVLEDPRFSAMVLGAHERVLTARLLALAGRRSEARDLAHEALLATLQRDPSAFDLYEIRDLFAELNASEDFRRLVDLQMGPEVAQELLSELNELHRTGRPPRRYRGVATR